MTNKKPTSFKIFVGVISITALVFLAASICTYYQVDRKYSMLLAFIMFVAFSFTTVGIYSGFKFKTEEKNLKRLNRIGVIGNFLIFLFTISLMAYAALMKANT